jgi:hypothetical protein
MASLGKRLMRIGTVDEDMTPALRALIARLRADVGRFTAGQAATGRVRIVEGRVVVEIQGRNAGCVARQIERRVPAGLAVLVEDGPDWRRITIQEQAHEGPGPDQD